ncbi:hypothetical protein KILIM_079_00210 [Kineosphaera limosa NBRC 100340]|uniref:Uncharacterized protein n=1 Tax=Kineosphaera limosa NBRC 100340 TaxID=1184609 RepID=K6VNC3_9MICO|nr:hypothetical protein KILIM_079_00210 [Kineosphaera limosa NBRC 100340]
MFRVTSKACSESNAGVLTIPEVNSKSEGVNSVIIDVAPRPASDEEIREVFGVGSDGF